LKHADLRDMFTKTTKSVCASTTVVSPDLLSLLYQVLQVWRLLKTQRGI